jgi:hypothetical protein
MAEEARTGAERLESFAKWIGVVGALIAVFTGVYQLWQANLLDAREMRWKQAQLAKEMVDKMVADEGWKAMEMLDWDDEGRTYRIQGRNYKINAKTVYTALEKDTSDDKDRYIIDRLDRTFFMVSQLEAAVRSDLVRLEDVRFPLTWYAAKRLCPRKKLFEDYIRENAAPETMQFFERLEEWRSCAK